MTNREKIAYLKQCRNYLTYIKTNYVDNANVEILEKEKVKVKVLKKSFYGRNLVVG